jgi:hypothetical protein
MSFFTVLVGSKIAMGALAIGTIAAGGTAAAAYTGSLPTPLQQAAHGLIGAPAPTESEIAEPTAAATATPTATATPGPGSTTDPTASPVGPDATGPAAFGLCTAFTHGGLATSSTAYASLVTAAGGANALTSYCATVSAHGKSAEHGPTSTAAPSISGSESTDAAKKTSSPMLPSQGTSGAAHKSAPGRP